MAKHEESNKAQQGREGEPVQNLPLFEEQREESTKNQQSAKGRMRVGKKRTLRDKWRLTSLSNKIITIATVVIAGASVLTFGTAFFQWLEMRDAGKQTDKIIAADERLVKAMENSVWEGDKSLNASVEQFHRDQRAWIGVSDPIILAEPDGSRRIETTVRNTGKTPAPNVEKYSFMETICCNLTTIVHKPKLEHLSNIGTLPPNGSFPLDYPIEVKFPQEAKPGTVVQVRGIIRYWDVFHQKHFSNFCYFPAAPRCCFQFCSYGNDTDDNPEYWPPEGKKITY